MNSKIQFEIFHGTSYDAAKSIMSEGKFTFNHRIDHWIGDGVYFFIDDFNEAKWWAETKFNGKKKKTVLKYPLIIGRRNLLDLNTVEDSEKLGCYGRKILKSGYSIELSLDEEKYIEQCNSERQKRKVYQKLTKLHLLELYIEEFNETPEKIQAVSYSFDNNMSGENINCSMFPPRQNQLNLLDESLINFNKLELIDI